MTTAGVERAWCVVVPHHPRGAHIARHKLAENLAALTEDTHFDEGFLADVASVVGELVGNAVRHAQPLPGGVIRLAYRLSMDAAGALLFEVRVTDGGAAGMPHPRAASGDAVDGRGLAIVEALASRWGVDRDGLGQSVWAEFTNNRLTDRLRAATPVAYVAR
jgi:anti-sigma regulatory factor (Ser/Thr protein kinase)